MTVLNQIYASGGPEVLIDTLEIVIRSQRWYLTEGWEDVRATLETGETVTFTAAAIAVALPARNADGTQNLQFAISNVDGAVSTAIRDALADLSSARLIYRQYHSGDLNAPAERPTELTIKSGYWTAPEVQITAGYMNLLDTAWPRRRFTTAQYPGLRHLSGG